MDLQIQGRNLEISDQIKEPVTKKLGLIYSHLPDIVRVAVEIATEATRALKDRVVVQVTLNVSGTLLRAQQRAANTKTAVNAVAQVSDSQIKRYKGQTSGRPEVPLNLTPGPNGRPKKRWPKSN